MQKKAGASPEWRGLLGELVFFAPKFWFPALIAAAVFPSLIAYSGPIFSALALWIVLGILVAGLIITLAHGYRFGSTLRYRTVATLVESQLGRTVGAFTAAASLLSLLIAIAALISTGTTFVVVSLGLPLEWRVVLVVVGFALLHLMMLNASVARRVVPGATVLVFVIAFIVMFYGYLRYFLNGGTPTLWQLLSGSTLAGNALTGSYFTAGWQAISVAALLLVPVSPQVTMFRNETPHQPLSGTAFRFLGGSAAALFALTVFLSFTVKGFDWTRLDTVVQGPGNLVLLLEVILGENNFLVVPLMAVLSLGCLVAAYIYLSSASVLLTEFGRRDFLPHQVPVSWRQRGRSAIVIVFILLALGLALFAHTRMDLVALAWVFFVSIASFLGQVARFKMWKARYWSGDTFDQRRAAKKSLLIALISVGISLFILVVVSLAFSSGWQLVAIAVWLSLCVLIVIVNETYQKTTQKVSAMSLEIQPLKRSIALALVPNFNASSVKTIRYAWAAHHPRLEVVVVSDGEDSAKALRSSWEELDLAAPLTLLAADESDHLEPVAQFVQALLDTDPATTVSVYLPRRISGWRLFGFMHNATERAYANRLGRLDRVTITWVGLQA